MDKRRLLFVDDEPMVLKGLQRTLRSMRREWEMAFVASGREALSAMQTRDFDVVVSDMRMPEMSGIQVLETLREAGVGMPIVMLTTSREENDVINALQNGARGYLLKDMEPDDLIKALNDIVAGQTVVAPELTIVLAEDMSQVISESLERGSSEGVSGGEHTLQPAPQDGEGPALGIDKPGVGDTVMGVERHLDLPILAGGRWGHAHRRTRR